MKKDIILFDLDGTIIDSSQGIFASIGYALEQLGCEPVSLEVLRTFVGPPLLESFLNLGLSEEQAVQAVKHYRALYQQEAVFMVEPYEHIETTLAELSKTKRLFLATSKPEVFAKQILEHLGFADYFEGIYGADLKGQRTEKADVIAYALASSQLTEPATMVMVGDRKHDLLGAQTHQLDSIGVLYGFGDQEELTAAGATAIATTPQELLMIIE